MAHHVYKTTGIILQAIPSGDSNLFLSIFTRELGLIKATAQGVRYLKSKLRYSTQKYDFSIMSFVYGKHTWRLTNASSEYNIYYESRD